MPKIKKYFRNHRRVVSNGMGYLDLYAKFLKKFFKPKALIRVVFDCSNGTTGIILKRLFLKSKLRSILINYNPDGSFPAHGPNPMVPGALRDLQLAVKKYKADLGVIFDADGDRGFFVDERGREIPSDIVAGLLGAAVKEDVILDLRCGYLARELLVKAGKKIIDSRVGAYFIKKLMREKKVEIAVELSAHYYFKDFFFADAGIFAAIQMINQVSLLKIRGRSLAKWIDSLPTYFRSGELNFKVVNKSEAMKRIENFYKKSASKIFYLDGVKMEFSDAAHAEALAKAWWFNIRPSNTENLLRLNLEAKDRKVFQSKLDEIKKLIEK